MSGGFAPADFALSLQKIEASQLDYFVEGGQAVNIWAEVGRRHLRTPAHFQLPRPQGSRFDSRLRLSRRRLVVSAEISASFLARLHFLS